MNANAIVQKLWRLCTVLRKDGITYQQYVTELTYLLFLKMMAERKQEIGCLPTGTRWNDLVSEQGIHKLERYRMILGTLGSNATRFGKQDQLIMLPDLEASENEAGAYADARSLPDMVHAIFNNASTSIREPKNLYTLVKAIDDLNWFSDERDQFGDLYEGLLQKNAEETKRGAGQYFTPRVLTELLVRLMQPTPGEVIQDPAAGTGGFLIAADRYMRVGSDAYSKLNKRQAAFQKKNAFQGMENVPGTFRLLLMNLYLHGIDSEQVFLGDTLSEDATLLEQADLILTNPPFGPSGGPPTRDDLSVTAMVASYALPFVEHCIRALKPGARAAIVVPDNVLFEDGRGKALRQMMMDWCDVHTILRLPTGIFYAQGVKTNVIFLTRGKTKKANTEHVWIYDLRSHMPKFGKNTPLAKSYLDQFEHVFGGSPYGKDRTDEQDEGVTGRWRRFKRDEISHLSDNLDIVWLGDEIEEGDEGLSDPDDIAAAILRLLQSAMAEIQTLSEELGLEETKA